MVKIEDFSKPKYLDYGKVFLVLYFKGFSWVDELKNRFEITTSKITQAIKILKENDLVTEVEFVHLNLKEKKLLWEFNPLYYKLNKFKPQIYKVTEKIKIEDGYFLYESLRQESKYNENLQNFIKKIAKYSNKNLALELKKEFKLKKEDLEIEYELEDLDFIKVYLVLYFKGFTWKKELENEFNISTSNCKKAIELLETRGFIISKDFFSLDLDQQDAIRKLSPAYINLIKQHPKIFTLSSEGMNYGNFVIDSYKKEAKINSSLQATINFINEKTKSYQILLNKYEKEENSQFSRKRIDHSTGILYETTTKKQKQFKYELKKALKDIRLEKLENKKQNLLSSAEKKELVILQKNRDIIQKNEINFKEKNYSKNDLNKNLYNGKEIGNLEFDEILKKENIDNEPVSVGIELIEVEKEHAQKFSELKKKLGIDVKKIHFMNKKELEICEEVIKQIKKKGWMDVFAVQRSCGSPKVFHEFVKLAEENNIFDDGEDFKYVKN